MVYSLRGIARYLIENVEEFSRGGQEREGGGGGSEERHQSRSITHGHPAALKLRRYRKRPHFVHKAAFTFPLLKYILAIIFLLFLPEIVVIIYLKITYFITVLLLMRNLNSILLSYVKRAPDIRF